MAFIITELSGRGGGNGGTDPGQDKLSGQSGGKSGVGVSNLEDQNETVTAASFAEEGVLVDAVLAPPDLVRAEVRGDGAASLVQAAAAPATVPSADGSYSKRGESHSNGASGLDQLRPTLISAVPAKDATTGSREASFFEK